MFLKNITIRNYKSLKDVDVSFKDGMNIIIGKNGTGKSNLLGFISGYVRGYTLLLGDLGRQHLEYDYSLMYRKDRKKHEMLISVSNERNTQKETPTYDFKVYLTKKVGNVFEYEQKEFKKISELQEVFFLTRFVGFNMPDKISWFSKPIKCDIDNQGFLNSEDGIYSGLNITASFALNFENKLIKYCTKNVIARTKEGLQYIVKTLFDTFDEIDVSYKLTEYLAKCTTIEKVRLSPNVNSYLIDNKILLENLVFEFKINDSWVPWSYLSDGTKRIFYLIAECLSLQEGLLLVEEPELGIHPHQLFKLMDFLKEQSRTKQIIISTHSPMVLDILEANELDRITIAKIDKNGSHFSKLAKKEREKAAAYMQETGHLSDYWLHSDLEGDE